MTSDTQPLTAVETPVPAPAGRSGLADAPAAGAVPVERLSPGGVITIVVLAFSTFVAALSEMVLGVALPHVMSDLGVPATTGQWLTTGYALTLAVIIPTTGYIMQRFQLRTIFITSVGLFSLGTAIAAAAPGFELLLTGRIVQALGTAVLVPIIMLPLALLGLVIGGRQDAEPHHHTPDLVRHDVAGALRRRLRRSGLRPRDRRRVVRRPRVRLLPGRDTARRPRHRRVRAAPAPSPATRRGSPRPAHLHLPRVRPPVITFVFLVLGAFALVTVLPLFMQESLGLGSLETGLLMAPGGATIGIVSLIVGRHYDRAGARGLAIPGIVVVSAGWWFMTTFDQHTSVWVVLARYVVVCAGQAFAWVAISLGSLPSALTAHGSAALNTVQQLAGAAGLAVLIAVLSAYADGTDAAAVAHGARAASTVGAVIALVALVTTFSLPRHREQGGRRGAAAGR